MNPRWLVLYVFLFFSIQLKAGPRVEIQEPIFSGSGCPKGTADVVISPDAKRLDIIFDSFFVEADTAMGYLSSKKNCDVVIKIKVPHGFSLAVERVRYNGVNNLPFGSNAHLQGTHFFNHEDLASVDKRFYGNTSSDFDVSARIPYQGLYWTPCGETALITSRTNLAVSASKSLRAASVQVDDRNLHPGISYDLLWRSCQEQRLE